MVLEGAGGGGEGNYMGEVNKWVGGHHIASTRQQNILSHLSCSRLPIRLRIDQTTA